MDTIQQILGNQYAMFYHSNICSNQLIPLQTLLQCISRVNQAMNIYGRDLATWPDQDANKVCKLVRAHVIYHRLSIEPIRKPILIHQEHNQFIVDCGDTRLMALNQLPEPVPVSVILTCRVDATAQYLHWTRIYNVADLSSCTGFDLAGHKIETAMTETHCDYALTWLEFGDYSTSHHLHDTDQRLNMMQQYLNQQSADFQFDDLWLLKEIKW